MQKQYSIRFVLTGDKEPKTGTTVDVWAYSLEEAQVFAWERIPASDRWLYEIVETTVKK